MVEDVRDTSTAVQLVEAVAAACADTRASNGCGEGWRARAELTRTHARTHDPPALFPSIAFAKLAANLLSIDSSSWPCAAASALVIGVPSDASSAPAAPQG